MNAPIDGNHHKGLIVYDSVTGDPMAVEGDASTGSLNVSNNIPNLKSVPVTLTGIGTVITAVPDKVLYIYATKIVCSAAISINFRDGATTDISGSMPMIANGGYIETIAPPAFLFKTTAGNSLDLVITGSGTASGRVSYWEA